LSIVVSIHAPARGATLAFHCFATVVRFNPRARAGRDNARIGIAYAGQFQSTRPRGARLASDKNLRAFFVSIHAPARGATIYIEERNKTKSFNPRARAGRDEARLGTAGRGTFQSTRPRGARRSDLDYRLITPVSIHAPARGATVQPFINQPH